MAGPVTASSPAPLPLSVLDLALVADGDRGADALHQTTETARRVEALGFHRLWVAEHHNMATVASTAPAVLMAHLAANTERIRIGSGGVMLPNHAPLAVAEQFALLESLHPHRIDLGIGRAPGTDRVTAMALRGRADNRDAEAFPQNLIDLMGLLGDRRRDHGLWDQLRPSPDLASSPDIFLLGSSDFSAQLAGLLGLPFAFAHHFDMGGTVEAVAAYRDRFEPSTVLDEPFVLVTASVLVAEDGDQAERLAAPNRLRRLGLRTGRLMPLMTPEQALAHPDYSQARALDSDAIVGTPDQAVAGLNDLAQRTGASELMLFTSTHDLADRLTSFALVAEAWGLSAVPASSSA